MMKIRKIVSIICAFSIMIVPLAFCGCNGATNYNYSDLQKFYNEIIYNNSDIFMNDGTVSVGYNNANLCNIIESSDGGDQFNKLVGDSTKPYAIFEPTFNASLMLVNEFIKKPYIDQTKFDNKHISRLYEQLLEFDNSLKQFTNTKTHLEERSTIDLNSATVKSWRDQLFVDYYKMIDVACDFSLDFADFYEKNVLGVKKVGDRYVANYMELKYLDMITEHARVYIDTVIKANYNRVVVDIEPSNVTKLINLYLTIPVDQLWTATDGATLTDTEQFVMQAFADYENAVLVFFQGKDILYHALSKVDYNAVMYQSKHEESALTVEQRNVLEQVGRFANTECANIYSYLDSFTTKLISFMDV